MLLMILRTLATNTLTSRPCTIAEILSPTTEAYDRGKKICPLPSIDQFARIYFNR
jgi:hypothetical protein